MKTKIYLPILLSGFLLIAVKSNAQFTVNKRHLKEINLSTDTVFISLNSFDEKEIQRYKKQDILEIINQRIENENKVLHQEITNDWSDKKIQFIDESVIEKRIKNRIPTLYLSAQIHNDRYFDKRVGRQRRYYYFQHYDINLNIGKKTIVSVPLVNEELNSLDLHFALSLIDYCIKQGGEFQNLAKFTKQINSRAGEISNDTLLISENNTDYSEQYLKSVFGANLKILDEVKILNKLHTYSESYVYLNESLTHTMDNPRFNHFVIRTLDNTPVLLYRNSTAFIKPCKHSCFFHTENHRLEYLLVVHFKQFKKIINKSI